MKVTDLTNNYIEQSLKSKAQEIYEACYPKLFDHYFIYWAKRDFPEPDIGVKEITTRAESIKLQLDIIEQAFQKKKINLDELEIVLFVGRNTSNGHAIIDKDKIIVWLPVETYHSKTMIDIFVTHEIIHALHYQRRAEYYFCDFDQFQNPMRQLITEGIATCLTAYIMDVDDRTALWGDYLSDAQYDLWLNQCESRESELRNYLVQAVLENKKIPQFFRADDIDDIMQFRAGYFLGLNLMRSFTNSNKVLPIELLSVSRSEFEKFAMQWLRE